MTISVTSHVIPKSSIAKEKKQFKMKMKQSSSRTCLQSTDEVPLDVSRQPLGLVSQLLGIVLSEVPVSSALEDGEDVRGRLELGDGDEADLAADIWSVIELLLVSD
jgi:hypothetical protein